MTLFFSFSVRLFDTMLKRWQYICFWVKLDEHCHTVRMWKWKSCFWYFGWADFCVAPRHKCRAPGLWGEKKKELTALNHFTFHNLANQVAGILVSVQLIKNWSIAKRNWFNIILFIFIWIYLIYKRWLACWFKSHILTDGYILSLLWMNSPWEYTCKMVLVSCIYWQAGKSKFWLNFSLGLMQFLKKSYLYIIYCTLFHLLLYHKNPVPLCFFLGNLSIFHIITETEKVVS